MQIKERRKRINLTQKDLAEQSGLNIRLIQDYEQGHRELKNASGDNLYRLASALMCNVDDLIEDRMEDSQYDGLRFCTYFLDEKTAEGHVVGNTVYITRYTLHPVKQIFFSDKMNIFQLSTVFENRLWPRNRDNINEILKELGLENYNPIEIIRKTHGKMRNDGVWIRFGNENVEGLEVEMRCQNV